MLCYFILLLRMFSFDVLGRVSGVSLELLRGSFYSQLNVLRSCDPSEQSITHSQKCQGGTHKFYQGLTLQKYQCFL